MEPTMLQGLPESLDLGQRLGRDGLHSEPPGVHGREVRPSGLQLAHAAPDPHELLVHEIAVGGGQVVE
jgi:hypothetical protein